MNYAWHNSGSQMVFRMAMLWPRYYYYYLWYDDLQFNLSSFYSLHKCNFMRILVSYTNKSYFRNISLTGTFSWRSVMHGQPAGLDRLANSMRLIGVYDSRKYDVPILRMSAMWFNIWNFLLVKFYEIVEKFEC